jgi:hypothetical protein
MITAEECVFQQIVTTCKRRFYLRQIDLQKSQMHLYGGEKGRYCIKNKKQQTKKKHQTT